MRGPEFPVHLHSTRFVFRDFIETDRAGFIACQMDERYRALYGHPDSAETRDRSNALFDRFLDWQHAQPRRNFQIGIFDRNSLDVPACAAAIHRPTVRRSASNSPPPIGAVTVPRSRQRP
ncbi:hypothetical protein [Thalassospira sp.]|uniref:hypothetical protein n=1 Tax=Thalassospira sp. TaxID=1912094 RepID=UPI0032EC55C9